MVAEFDSCFELILAVWSVDGNEILLRADLDSGSSLKGTVPLLVETELMEKLSDMLETT